MSLLLLQHTRKLEDEVRHARLILRKRPGYVLLESFGFRSSIGTESLLREYRSSAYVTFLPKVQESMPHLILKACAEVDAKLAGCRGMMKASDYEIEYDTKPNIQSIAKCFSSFLSYLTEMRDSVQESTAERIIEYYQQTSKPVIAIVCPTHLKRKSKFFQKLKENKVRYKVK